MIASGNIKAGIRQLIVPGRPSITDYFDGLMTLPDPEIRGIFETALKLRDEHRYDESMQKFSALLGLNPTADQHIALLILIGNNHYLKREYPGALGRYQEAWNAALAINNQEAAGSAYGNTGIVYHIMGKPDKALEFQKKALEIDRERGNKHGEATHLGNIGLIYRQKGESDKALEYHNKAMVTHHQLGNKHGVATHLGNIGLIYRQKGELDRALEYHNNALEIDHQLGNKHGEATHLGNIGLIYRQKGELDKALEFHMKAVEIDHQLGNKHGEANQLGNIGLIYQQKGESDNALTCFEQALKIYKATGAVPLIKLIEQTIASINNNVR